MESQDASDEEVPPTNMRKKDLSKSEQLEAIPMLVMMATENHLKRVAVMDIANMFNVACSTIYRLWGHMEHTHVTGIINSPKLVSWKINSGRAPKYLTEFIQEGVKEVPLRKRHTQ